jgi:hypothetical protein
MVRRLGNYKEVRGRCLLWSIIPALPEESDERYEKPSFRDTISMTRFKPGPSGTWSWNTNHSTVTFRRPYPISVKYILILCSHIRLHLKHGLSPLMYSTKRFMFHPSLFTNREQAPHCLPSSALLIHRLLGVQIPSSARGSCYIVDKQFCVTTV